MTVQQCINDSRLNKSVRAIPLISEDQEIWLMDGMASGGRKARLVLWYLGLKPRPDLAIWAGGPRGEAFI